MGISFLIKLSASGSNVVLSLMRLKRRCFPVNFAEFLRTTFSQNTSGRLLLNIYKAAVGADIRTHEFEHELSSGVGWDGEKNILGELYKEAAAL